MLLDALGYVGDALMKPGRMVRGAVLGRPDELLAGLPFSDTLGITDHDRAVTGSMLLDELGYTAPEDTTERMLTGIGAEILTDPLTVVGGTLINRAARGLAGARGAFRGAPLTATTYADDTFDLVSPGEREIQRLLDAPPPPVIADEIPPPPSEPWWAPMGYPPGADPADYGILPQVTEPLPPLTELPFPDVMKLGYGDDAINTLESYLGTPSVKEWRQLGVGYEWSPGRGILQDMLEEQGPMAAFSASMPAWDEVIDMLGRTPYGTLRREAGYSGNSVDDLWARLIGQRLGDLTTWQDYVSGIGGPRDPFMAELLAKVMQQEERLRQAVPFRRANHYLSMSTARNAIDDILRGDVAPGMLRRGGDEASGYLTPLAHLPIDREELIRLAATRQRGVIDRVLESRLAEQLADEPVDDAIARIGALEDPVAARYALDDLLQIAEPPRFGWQAEPNIFQASLAESPLSRLIQVAQRRSDELAARYRDVPYVSPDSMARARAWVAQQDSTMAGLPNPYLPVERGTFGTLDELVAWQRARWPDLMPGDVPVPAAPAAARNIEETITPHFQGFPNNQPPALTPEQIRAERELIARNIEETLEVGDGMGGWNVVDDLNDLGPADEAIDLQQLFDDVAPPMGQLEGTPFARPIDPLPPGVPPEAGDDINHLFWQQRPYDVVPPEPPPAAGLIQPPRGFDPAVPPWEAVLRQVEMQFGDIPSYARNVPVEQLHLVPIEAWGNPAHPFWLQFINPPG